MYACGNEGELETLKINYLSLIRIRSINHTYHEGVEGLVAVFVKDPHETSALQKGGRAYSLHFSEVLPSDINTASNQCNNVDVW